MVHIVLKSAMASLLSFLFLSLVYHSSQIYSQTDFKYDTFTGFQDDFYAVGDATLDSKLTLTGDRFFSYGRILRKEQIQICNSSSVANFKTEFTFEIQKKDPLQVNADGFAFMMTAGPVSVSNQSYGRWLALVEPDKNGLPDNKLVAIEFDTFKNLPFDGYLQFQDEDNNHVGVDINSVISANSSSLYPFKMFLGSGSLMAARIEYDASLKKLSVYVQDTQVLQYNFDICLYISGKAYVGFSAGSGSDNIDFHKISTWNFSSTALFVPTGTVPNKDSSWKIILAVCLPLGFLLAVGVSWCLVLLLRRRSVDDLVQLPHEIDYTDLYIATNGFSEENVLGCGGFGSVYKGFLRKDQSTVAIKRISKQSHQGEQVQTISHLSHRNLVKLRGWCKQKKELILVYEYMPRGSLDKALFDSEQVLPWDVRYRILCGVAAALMYIHEDWNQQVVHRDIKCSNIMLDADFNARLGDFGLAKVVEHDSNTEVSTTLAGTLGYMAPEVLETFTFTPATDRYSFGVVALEIVCGRKAIQSARKPLVEWVQKCYSQGNLLDVVDPPLERDYDEAEVVRMLKTALMCVDDNPNKRPSMRPVHYILTGEISFVV